MHRGPRRGAGTLVAAAGAGALALGLAAAWLYSAHDLSLSHYDAKAHLVVARRIFDSLTPGWRQIGAVWLPLPHLLNAGPVQVDAFYRWGTSGVAISIVSFVVSTLSLAWLVYRATGSRAGTLAASAVFATDPNLLYLQATPMTEPLLLAGITLSTALVFRWVLDDGVGPPAAAGWAIVGACLTRYEAWPVTAALLGLAGIALLARGVRVRDVVLRVVGLAVYPAGAVLAFLVLSRATVGEWFVTGGFYVPDNEAHGKPLVGLAVVGWGLWKLVGAGTLAAGAVGVLLASWAVWRDRRRAAVITTFALAGCAALPWYAFVSGHPFRIRYMVVLVAALAACAGLGVGLLPRRTLRGVAAGLVLLVALVERPPFASTAPMVAEAQWDRPFAIGRRKVTACLAAGFVRPRHKVLVSMGSLAHYMQELSHAGFALDDFVHEGIGQLWPEALAAPSRHVAWILVEERAEGGDMLAALRRRDPHFTLGFARVCEGGGVALYRRESAERREAGHATARVISERPAVRIDDIR